MQRPSVKGFLAPKIWKIAANIINVVTIITSPTIAATIWFRAASTFSLLPPEIIHLMPPYIRKAIAKITPTTKSRVMTNWTICSMVVPPATAPGGGTKSIGIRSF